MSDKTVSIGKIGNYYGGLSVKGDGSKQYWGIEDWDGTFWEEIPSYLRDALLKFESERDGGGD